MRIVSFGQMVNIERGGSFTHQFTLEAEDGSQHNVETDEGTIGRLIEIYTGVSRGAPKPAQQPVQAAPSNGESQYRQWKTQMESSSPSDSDSSEYEDGADLFGGDYDPGEVANEAVSRIVDDTMSAVMGAVAELPVQSPPASRGLGSSPAVPIRAKQPRVDKDGFVLPVQSRTVPKDELGYPIVSNNRRSPSIPDDDGSEDGTQM